MLDLALSAVPALNNYFEEFDGVSIREATGLAIVSIALPNGGEAAADKAIKSSFGIAPPAVGNSVLSSDGNFRLARLGRDSLFVLFAHDTPDAESFVAGKLKGAAYTTDQTDVWVGIDVSGPKSRAVLERICPIDIADANFAVGYLARTTMEHLGTLIIRTGKDEFQLLSASSSAASFLHGIETSVKNVI